MGLLHSQLLFLFSSDAIALLLLFRFPLTLDDGKVVDCTVEKYFLDTHKMHLKYPNLPCLHVGSKNKNIFLPLEVLCGNNI